MTTRPDFRFASWLISVSTTLLLLLPSAVLYGQIPYESGELQLALEKLQVLGSVLYISAHPDDENTAFLATMAKEHHVRTGYLSITRGEGGQNLLGPEQGDELGLIRTQELLAARRIDGAEQYFTRAIDFGYSKTSEESLEFWGKSETIADVVWVIRKFRPDVIVTRFTPTRGGHGNHTASAILAYEAFRAAADPDRFPEQLKYLPAWQAKRIVWNVFRFSRGAGENGSSSALTVDLGQYSPLLGLSLGELAGKSRSMHKSQGFGALELRGTWTNSFEYVDGDSARADLFDGVVTSWKRVKGGGPVQSLLDSALSEFNPLSPQNILPHLLRARKLLLRLGNDPWVKVKLGELDKTILGCSGIWIDAAADAYQVVPGSVLPVTVTALNRLPVSCQLKTVQLSVDAGEVTVAKDLVPNVPVDVKCMMNIPATTPSTQPYWLEKPAAKARYTISDLQLVGMPENPPFAVAHLVLTLSGEEVAADIPVRYRWVDPTQGERYRALAIVPPVSVALSSPVVILKNGDPRDIGVVVRNLAPAVRADIALDLPPGWSCEPKNTVVEFDSTNAERIYHFQIRPGKGAQSGTLGALARVGTSTCVSTVAEIAYSHFPPQTFLKKAEARLVLLDVRTTPLKIGYIMGAGDDVSGALSQLGYSVELLSDEDLESGDLNRFDAIVAGVRAYNTRAKLRSTNGRLLEYVRQGGRYIVQYTRPQSGISQIGPFPFTITGERVSVEEAPVTFQSPGHSLLLKPNRITAADFEGWVQERGLYFAGDWSPEYQTVLESHDPGEEQHRGGLLYGKFGKGYFIYTGYSFFRQLPAGVPGAYRLFVNLISQDVDH